MEISVSFKNVETNKEISLDFKLNQNVPATHKKDGLIYKRIISIKELIYRKITYSSNELQDELTIKTAARLLYQYGIPYYSRENKNHYIWDKKKVNLWLLYENSGQVFDFDFTSNVFHEIAHWLISDNKHYVDYGLGTAVESLKQSSAILGNMQVAEEERNASVLGMLLEMHHGYACSGTFHKHGWSETRDINEIYLICKSLKRKGFINSQGLIRI